MSEPSTCPDGPVGAGAGADHADGVDQGDLRSAVQSQRAEADVAVFTLPKRIGTAATERHLVVDLVLVGKVVDEPGTHGVLGEIGPVVDELAHFRRRAVAALGETGDQLFVEIGVERLGHLAMGGRERVLGEGVRRRLVVADMERIREGAELVEGAAKEKLVARHAGEVERRRRHEEDLVAGARQVVGLVAAVLEERDNRLLRPLEVDDGIAHFLHLAPERRVAGRTDDDARDAPVDARLAQRIDDGSHGRRRFEEHTEAPRFGLLETAAHLEHQRRVGGHLRSAPRRQAQKQQPGRRDGDRHEDEYDHDHDTASSSHWGLLRSSIAAFAKATAVKAGFARETRRAYGTDDVHAAAYFGATADFGVAGVLQLTTW